MGKSRRIRVADLREIYLLVGECCELGGDPIAWRVHMLERLRAVLGGMVAFELEGRNLPRSHEDHRPTFIGGVDVGWPTERDRATYREYVRRAHPNWNPAYEAIADLDAPLFSRLRRQVVPDHRWYRSWFYGEVARPLQASDMLICRHLGDDRSVQDVCIHRGRGATPFGERERRLLKLFFREFVRLHGRKLAPFGAASTSDLPGRLRQVLAALMQGESEKRIAQRLGISPHTVRDHVKRLHKHFCVASRGELLAHGGARSATPGSESAHKPDLPHGHAADAPAG